MGLLVRPLVAADRGPLERLLNAISEFSADEKTVALEVIDGALNRPEDYECLVAVVQDQAVGFVAYGQTPMTESTFDLYWLAAHPASRRLGVGSALVAALDQAVRATGGQRIRVETSSQDTYKGTCAFYERQGYLECGRIKDFYKPGDDLIIMSRQVAVPAHLHQVSFSFPQRASDAMIELDEVRKSYGEIPAVTWALSGISLKIEKGEFVSIMGPSGSGKSTLLHLLGALDVPTSGRVALAGQDISTLSDQALTLFRREKLGFVFQFFNLLPTMNATENAALPALLCKRPRAEAFARAQRLLEAVGLGHRLSHRPDQLSGGEMQRVAIARALINDPMVILADEPTGNLDSASGVEILNLLAEAARRRGVTVVMVTHDAHAAAAGDRIVRLKDGKVVADHAVARPLAAVVAG